MQRNQLLPRLLNLAVFILLEIASLHLIVSNAALQRLWINRGAHAFMGTVWGASQRISDYFSLAKTNDELSQEVFRLNEQLTRAREQLARIEADSARVQPRAGFTMTPARIVKISRNKQHNYLILDRGYDDGIHEESGIITQEGVVGIVQSVSQHHCFAYSFQNKDFSISARLGRGGSSGLLIWDGIHGNGAILKEVPLQSRYQPGDTVFTSGHSLLFPPDIPLGIAGNAKVVNGTTNEVSVSLFQDFSALRYVTVVYNNDRDEIEEFTP